MFSEKGLHSYGTQLPLLEMDDVPSKKPVYAQDQIATDEQGRRRFHGAFTGGFSAGYWNTVGSKEGWTPQSFKSSRSEKAGERASQRPEDFMDDEDREEFGMAPKGLEIHEDFTGSEGGVKERKRKFLQSDMKPIPGEPVLHQLLKPIKDKVAVRILKAWGWRPGQGVGPRQTRKEKKKARERNKKELYLMEKYGCELPTTSKTMDSGGSDNDNEMDEESDEEEITFAPEDHEAAPVGLKNDNYGIGYKPLSRQSVLGAGVQNMEHIVLFKPLEAMGKNNKKISFAGQGFGVGALEEDDDEDVYATDDLTRYDFTLENKKKAKKNVKSIAKEDMVFEDFILDLNPEKPEEYKIEIPFGWQPRNWYQKKSRFQPLDPVTQRHLERKMLEEKNNKDQKMTREKRAELLGEELRKQDQNSSSAKAAPQSIVKPSILELQKQQKERQEKTKSLLDQITKKSSSFTTGGIITLDGEEKSMSSLTAEEISSSFKPFINNPGKQKRYELFLSKDLKTDGEITEFLKTIQPVELSLWDRQMEQKEFVQAKKLYRPLQGIMSDRFVTESEVKAEQKVAEIQRDESKKIVMERTTSMWKPHSLLCKRFNIPEPFGGHMEEERKPKNKSKMSVFDYLETSVNKKADFQTPVIIPKNIERPKEIVKQNEETEKPEETAKEEHVALEWQNVLEGKEKKSENTETAATFKPKTELERKVVESLDKPITEKRELFKSIFSDSESDHEEDWDKEVNTELDKAKADFVFSLTKPASAAAANLLRNASPPRGIFKALFNATVATVDLTKEKEKTIDLTQNNEKAIDLKQLNKTAINLTPTESTIDLTKVNESQKSSISIESERILFKPKSFREPNDDKESLNVQSAVITNDSKQQTDSLNTYGPALPTELIKKMETQPSEPQTTTANCLDDKLMSLWHKHQTPNQKISAVWIEKPSKLLETSDSSDDSCSSDDSGSSNEKSSKHQKKSKKSKKKKSSSHAKHKKVKEHKSNKKVKHSKDNKRKKKHKKK